MHPPSSRRHTYAAPAAPPAAKARPRHATAGGAILARALVAGLAACATYEPAPVDLAAHAAAFALRAPAAASLADGLDRAEAAHLALWFHPELRRARLQAGVARVEFDESGRLNDPQLQFNVEHILESAVPHRWLVGTGLALTLPLTGVQARQRDLAGSEFDAARLAARTAEAKVLGELDLAWSQWSAAVRRRELQQALLERLRALETIATRLADAQEIPRAEARAFTLQRLAREIEIAGLDATIEQRHFAVRALLGLPPDLELPLVAAIDVPPRLPAAAADPAPHAPLLASGPQVMEAAAAHQVAERQLALEVSQQWQSFSVMPGYTEEDAQPRPTFWFALPLPLWNRNVRAIAAARAQREVAAETLRIALERALQELARTTAQLQRTRALRDRVESDLLPLAEQQLQDGRTLAERGQLDTLLLLQAVLSLHDAQQSAVDAAVAEAAAQVAWNSLFWPTVEEAR